MLVYEGANGYWGWGPSLISTGHADGMLFLRTVCTLRLLVS